MKELGVVAVFALLCYAFATNYHELDLDAPKESDNQKSFAARVSLPAAPKEGAKALPKFLADNLEAALATQERYGIPASVVLAQAAFESGYGKSRLAKQGRNFFGIKCRQHRGPGHRAHCLNVHDDSPLDRFIIYESRKASFEAHANLLSQGRYQVLFSEHFVSWHRVSQVCNYNERLERINNGKWEMALYSWHNPPARWAYGLDALGYATNENYASIILAIIERYNLTSYDRPKRNSR